MKDIIIKFNINTTDSIEEYENEVKRVLSHAQKYLFGKIKTGILYDKNGKIIGEVIRFHDKILF